MSLLALIALWQPLSAEQTIIQTLGSVTPTPNGTNDLGTVNIDTRRLNGLQIEPGLLQFTQIGRSIQVQVLASLSDGSRFDVTSAIAKTTYSIVDSLIASVDANGRVMPIADGITILNAYHLGRQARAVVLVNTALAKAAIEVSPASLELGFVGDRRSLRVRSVLDDGTGSDVAAENSTTYESGNPGVVSVSTVGIVTAVGPGATSITIRHDILVASAAISVVIPSANVLANIEILPAAVIMRQPLATRQLSITGIQQGGGRIDLTPAATGTTYQSSSSSVAVVLANGLIKAIAGGATRITVANSGFSASVLVRVSFSDLQSVSIAPRDITITLPSGSPAAVQQVVVLGRYSDGTDDDLTGDAGTAYQSSNSGIATVSPSGKVSFTQDGRVTITATSGTISSSAQFTITRFRPAPLGIISGVFTNVTAQGQSAFLTAGTGGFRTVDVSNPSSPFLAGTASTSGNMVDVKLSGSRAFVAETSGLAIFNVADIANPSRQSTISGTSVIAVAADAGRVYYTDGTTLKILDAATLSVLGQLPGLAASAQGLASSGGLAFVAMGGAGLAVVDVTVASGPVLAATVPVPGGAFNVSSRSRVAFVPGTGSPRSVYSIEASIPSAAALVGQTNITMNAHGVAVSGALMVVAENIFVNSMPIFNVSDPANPAYLGTVDFPGDGEGSRVALADNLSFLINGSGPNPGLYIGIVAPVTSPVPPTVSLLSPSQGAKVVEGAGVSVLANAASNLGVANVAFSVNGVVQSTDATGPYTGTVRIPMGTVGTAVVISAQSQDFGGQLSIISSVTVTVTPDPLTTVQGRLTDVFGNPIANAPIRLIPGLQTTSAADGSFLITHVPTSQGTIPLSSTATVSGHTIYANVQKPPVLSGITDFGSVVLNGNVTLSGAVSGTLVPILSPYKVTGSAIVNTGQTLSVPAGTILKFAPAASLTVNGTLTTSGSSASPVVFTSLADDATGGDTGGDGPTIGAPGQYTGLIFTNANAATNLSFTRFLYGQSVQVTAGLATFNDDLFASMSVAAIRMSPGARVAGANNQATGNPVNGVDLVTGDMSTPGNNWADIGLPYSIRAGGVNLRQSMSISAGVIVKLLGGSLTGQEGALTVNGTPSLPVSFTSFKDDSLGGDTNGDASLTSPAPGDWVTIALGGNSLNTLNNVIARYGGGASNSMMAVNNPTTMMNVEVSSSLQHGMLVQTTLTLSSGTASANTAGGGIYLINGASATLTGVTFLRNKTDGLRLDGNAKAFVYSSAYENNAGYGVFANNSGAGSYLNMSTAAFTGNAGVIKLAPAIGAFNLSGAVTINNSGLAGVDVLGDANLSTVKTWTDPGMPYVLRNGASINLRQNMTVAPGVIFKLQGASITGQEGSMTFNGTAARPVVFTSLKDDDFGGDTNGDASLTSPTPGDWVTIALGGNSPNALNNVIARYGGGASNSMMAVNNPTTMMSVEVSSSLQHGMLVQTTLTLSSGTASANTAGGGIYLINGASATLTDVTFRKNKTDGLRLDGNAKAFVYSSAYENNAGYGVFANNSGAGSYLNMSTAAFTGNAGVIKLAPAIGAFNLSGAVTINNSGLAGVDVLGDANLSTVKTWTDPGMPYVLRNGASINLRQNMTVAPGVIFKLQGASITGQEGSMTFNGTAARPVIFTSLKDDSLGGDTNGDASLTSPAPGDWVTIALGGNSPNTLNNVIARYGGGASNSMMAVNNPTTMMSVEVSSSLQHGMLVQTTLTLSSGTASANTAGGGIYLINGASATLTGVTFLRNKTDGLRLDGNAKAFVYNSAYENNAGYGVFANNSGAGGYLNMSTAAFTGNSGVIKLAAAIGAFNLSGAVTISNSGFAGVDVLGEANLSTVKTWTNPGMPYILRNGPINLRQNMTVAPGVIFKLQGASITGQEGSMIFNGTPAQPVVFTSLKDDDFGGDTNGDASLTSPVPGDWVTIALGGNSLNTLNNVIARYGGGASNSMMAVNNPTTMMSVEVSSSLQHGMLVQTTLTLSSGTAAANTAGGGIYLINGASATLTDVTFRKNKTDGLRLDGNAKAFVYNSTYDGNAGYGVFANNPNSGSYLNMSTAAFTGNSGVIKLAPAIGAFNLSGAVTISNSGFAGVDVLGEANLSTVKTWTDPGMPYILRNGAINLRQNMTVAPGVIFKLQGASITGQEGSMTFNGTAARPVVFTSLKDDDFGGDTNGDASLTSPAPGDWVTIALGGNSQNTLNNVVARYGGGASNSMMAVNNPTTMMNVEVSSSLQHGMLVQTTLTLSSGTAAANTAGGGIYLINGASATLTNVTFLRNKTDGLRLDGNAKAFVYNSTYEGNVGYGVFANNPNTGGSLVIATSAFTGNAGVIKLAPALNVFSVSGPISVSNSGLAGIDVLADGNVGAVARTWGNAGIPYVLRNGDVSFRQNITFAPGVIVKLQNSSIGGQEGALIAPGTSASPIIFTSIKDDSAGGDTNGDGAVTTPAPGDWRNVSLGSSGSNLWSHVAVRYGGGGGFGYMVIANNNLTASFSDFSRSSTWGLFANSVAVNITSSTISNNTVGVRSTGAASVISGCSITGNSTFGAQGAQNAANNYWGSATGPTVASNPGGTGDAVDAAVTYAPFLTSPPSGIGP